MFQAIVTPIRARADHISDRIRFLAVRHCVVSKNCVREASACVERIRFIISGRRKGTKDRLRATRYVDFSPLRKARSIVERDVPIRPEFWRRDLFT